MTLTLSYRNLSTTSGIRSSSVALLVLLCSLISGFSIPGGLIIGRNETTLDFGDTTRTVLARSGETAELPCEVRNLKENVVSWIRKRDLQIITSGLLTFTSDSRFQLANADQENIVPTTVNWNLQLRRVVANDAGIYECQVNTEPKMKRVVTLLVAPGNMKRDSSDEDDVEETDNELVAAEHTNTAKELEQITTILGPTERYLQLGSKVTITCEVRTLTTTTTRNRIGRASRRNISSGASSLIQEEDASASGPDRVDDPSSEFRFHYYSGYKRCLNWYYFDKLLTFRPAKASSVIIETDTSPDLILSRLTITSLSADDAGMYICKPLQGQPSNVTIHVIQESEDAQAMQPPGNFLQYNRAISFIRIDNDSNFLLLTLTLLLYFL